ncbi:hypothetical protein HZZ13_36045 [Bradyrhizobium sp. CNPSo 4010]|uniref:Insecticide toxin TcdB middle/N-terminal domain-containing protein n=1 Tax=Bradyrhizobium agreste TaxID=2751811 RepID=A0ABS0Q109_9BRAD|nr:SpvB/TcaC N-terminal domain-containing protein [Bradyrhizobium agreste]MBH5403168.1 hypothetical protein [Bradyrhizobium agreste]
MIEAEMIGDKRKSPAGRSTFACLRQRSAVVVAATTFFVGPAPGIAGTMSVPGNFAVSPTGAATYSIPISVPPGVAGMMPALSLAYSSQSGNGPLGMGWTLSGLPSIGRCGRTLAQDGALGGVNYDANDRFCMNGQRLVAISGTYGADGTQYRTEIETFSKIISHGSEGSGPGWFEVRTKSGQIMEFGNTADSRILAQGKTSVRVWALARAGDSKSNYYTVTYTNDTANGQFYPSRIDYTGNTTAGSSPSNSVQFVYATRPDIIPQYQAGSRITTAYRLTNVQAYAGSTLVSDYQLAYEQSGPANRSRMTSLTICDASNNCLPSTTFNWTSTATTFGPMQTWIAGYGHDQGWGDNNTHPRTPVDVNGDGLPDVVAFGGAGTYVSLNTGTSFGPMQTWIAGYGYDQGWGDNNTHPRMLVDVNGDGLPDVVAFGGGGTYVSLNTGTSFGPMQQWIAQYGYDLGWGDNNTHPRMLVDVNGDGLPDVVAFGGGGTYVSLNTGTSFGPMQQWIAQYGYDLGWGDNNTHPRMLSDVNGDGLPDVVAFGGGGTYVSLNTGTSFGPMQQWIAQYGYDLGWGDNNTHPRMLADVNADGLPDVVAFGGGGTYVSLNTGTSFGPMQSWIAGYGYDQGWGNNKIHPRMPADVNGDGLPDVVAFGGGGVYVSLNTGTSFGPMQQWVAQFGSDLGWTDSNSHPRFMVDVKGIAFTGVVGFGPSGTHVATPPTSGPAADVMISAVNGLGSATTVTYQPGTNTSVVTKGTGTAFPMLDLVSSAYVVSQVNTSNGIGGTVSASYTYSGGRIDLRRRAFLGFAQTGVKDLQTGIASTTTYRQDFPYTGMIASTAKSVTPGTPPGGAAAQGMQLTQLSNSYQFSNASGAASVSTPSINSAPYKVSLSQSVSSGADFDGSALPSVTTTNQYDAYLNPTQVVTSTSDGFSKTTVSTYSNDTAAWYLGRLTRSSVTGVAP